jgi:hypothetical protein
MGMFVGLLELVFRAEWCHSLKERRMVARSLVGRINSRFNVAVLEEAAETHQIIGLSVACLGHTKFDVDATMEKVLRFAEENSDAVLVQADKEIF